MVIPTSRTRSYNSTRDGEQSEHHTAAVLGVQRGRVVRAGGVQIPGEADIWGVGPLRLRRFLLLGLQTIHIVLPRNVYLQFSLIMTTDNTYFPGTFMYSTLIWLQPIHPSQERLCTVLSYYDYSQYIQYSPVFGTDPDRNRALEKPPGVELIPCRRKPLRRTCLLRDPAQTQVWSEQVWLNTTFISQGSRSWDKLAVKT